MNESLIFLEWLDDIAVLYSLNKRSDYTPSLSDRYLVDAFTWMGTPEGHTYWFEVDKLWQLELEKHANVLYEKPDRTPTWLK